MPASPGITATLTVRKGGSRPFLRYAVLGAVDHLPLQGPKYLNKFLNKLHGLWSNLLAVKFLVNTKAVSCQQGQLLRTCWVLLKEPFIGPWGFISVHLQCKYTANDV